MSAEPNAERAREVTKRAWAIGAAVLAVAAAAIGVSTYLSGPDDFEMWGAVRLRDSASHTTDDYCVGGSTYLDIREGAPVRVFGDGNALLATGRLQRGRVLGGEVNGDCGFDFAVPGVRGDQDAYRVQIDDEKPWVLSPAEAKSLVVIDLG